MNSRYLKIINGRIITPTRIISDGQLLIANGKIQEIGNKNIEVSEAEIIDAQGNYVAPGCIDTHLHGGNGHDFTEATPEAFYAIARAHALQGITTLYPTLAAAPIETFKKAIRTCEQVMDHPKSGARIMGLHLEGNYLSQSKKGAQDPNCIYPPDPNEYKELLNSTKCIKRWSAAPELEGGLEFGHYAKAHGVLVSLAHTTADYQQVRQAFAAGFTHATHFYNAMTSVHKNREYKYEGTVEGVYLMKDMTVEVVADGIHVPPAILELVYQIKGVERTSLITDAIAAAAYDHDFNSLADSRFIIEDGVCKLADRSAIAGSIATGVRLIRTLVEKTEIPLLDTIRMASESPARLMGILDRKGTLEKGKDADIILFDQDIKIQETIVEGCLLPK